jgi:hypothetical protein
MFERNWPATHQERQTMTTIDTVRAELRELLTELADVAGHLTVSEIHEVQLGLRGPIRAIRQRVRSGQR